MTADRHPPTGLVADRDPHATVAGPLDGGAVVRVVLADDQPLVRAGLNALLTDTAGVDVVGEATTGAEAVRLTRDLRPDVVVMDIRMPGMDGLDATRMITAGGSPAAVLILTTFDSDDNVYEALRAGASGFLVKDMVLDDIVAAIRVVAAGDALIAPSVTRRLIAEFAGRPEPRRPARALTGVTDREREVLTLVARGLSNSEIATHLVISVSTAKAHVANLLTKFGARDRIQLVIIAYESGVAP
jgi:DNA-binding NarL/FixJ family response regulator